MLNRTIDKNDVQGLILNLNFMDSKLSGKYNVGASEINLTGEIKKVSMEYGNFVFDVSLSESKGGTLSYTVNCPIKLVRVGAMELDWRL